VAIVVLQAAALRAALKAALKAPPLHAQIKTVGRPPVSLPLTVMEYATPSATLQNAATTAAIAVFQADYHPAAAQKISW
jgi:hypothetical protein